MPQCPICHCKTESTPKPIIATLAADSKTDSFGKLDLSDIPKRRCNLGELSSLVGILRNLTGTMKQTNGSADKTDSDIGHDDSFEEEVPGTFQEFYQKPKTPLSDVKSDKSETPTVRESQVTSLGTNSISLLQSIDRSKVNEETQTIPGSCLSPLHTNSARKVDRMRRCNNSYNNAQLNYFIDNIGKVESPVASFTPFKPECDLSTTSDESEVEGTCLSPFKMSNCMKKVEKQDEDHSTWEGEFQTEPWERELDVAKVDNRAKNLEPEPVAKRRCVSTSPNEATREFSLQQSSDVAKTRSDESIASGLQSSSPKKHLYLAYDVLNEKECEALSFLYNCKGVRIVSGIFSVPRGGIISPLPKILITHAIEKPRFGNGAPTRYNSIATCHRTYSYMKAVVLGIRCVDAQWLTDCQTSGTLLCCDSYSIWGDLESYNALIASGSKIEGDNIQGSLPSLDKTSPLKLDGAVFGFLDTKPNAQLLGFKPLTFVQISSLVGCWGGRVSNDSFTLMHVLIAPDSATLNQVIHELHACIKVNKDVTTESWSIEPFNDEELEALINNDGTLNISYGDDYRVPVIRAKWLENSICMNSLQSLKEYCIGVLCFEFDMGLNVGERQTLFC
ncbi:hypothetical protein ACHAXM_006806 [Skeletonema potamos]